MKGTVELGLSFPRKSNKQSKENLEVWSNSYWCGYKVVRRSMFGYLVKYMNAPISNLVVFQEGKCSGALIL